MADLAKLNAIREACFAILNSVSDTSAPEDWVETDGHVKALSALAREVSAAWREQFADRLHRLGDIELGERRFYAGKATKLVRKTEPIEIFRAVCQAAGGDFDAIEECLSANWYKQSSIADLSEELHKLCFEKVEVIEAKTGKTKLEPRLTR